MNDYDEDHLENQRISKCQNILQDSLRFQSDLLKISINIDFVNIITILVIG